MEMNLDEATYESLHEMFNSKGWEILQGDILNLYNNHLNQAPQDCKTGDEWQFRRGVLEVFRFVMNYPTLIENNWKSANENPE